MEPAAASPMWAGVSRSTSIRTAPESPRVAPVEPSRKTVEATASPTWARTNGSRAAREDRLRLFGRRSAASARDCAKAAPALGRPSAVASWANSLIRSAPLLSARLVLYRRGFLASAGPPAVADPISADPLRQALAQ